MQANKQEKQKRTLEKRNN